MSSRQHVTSGRWAHSCAPRVFFHTQDRLSPGWSPWNPSASVSTSVCTCCLRYSAGWETPPHSPSATADTSSCSARISFASRVRYWQRRSSCCSTVAMRRERVCRQLITDGSALACGRGRTQLRHSTRARVAHTQQTLRPEKNSPHSFPQAPLQVPLLSRFLCPL